MDFKINGVPLAALPAPNGFEVEVLDLDNAETTVRTTDGRLNRDRVAVKRQINITWPPLPASTMSKLLKQMRNVYFDFYYPDPEAGGYVTKTMYVGNRPATIPFVKDGELWWDGLKCTFTET